LPRLDDWQAMDWRMFGGSMGEFLGKISPREEFEQGVHDPSPNPRQKTNFGLALKFPAPRVFFKLLYPAECAKWNGASSWNSH
jgi:hypothetical protein